MLRPAHFFDFPLSLKLGTLHVYRTLDKTVPSLHHMPAGDADMHTQAMVLSDRTLFNVLKTLPLGHKIARLAALGACKKTNEKEKENEGEEE